jgi:hypothetical protein
MRLLILLEAASTLDKGARADAVASPSFIATNLFECRHAWLIPAARLRSVANVTHTGRVETIFCVAGPVRDRGSLWRSDCSTLSIDLASTW